MVQIWNFLALWKTRRSVNFLRSARWGERFHSKSFWLSKEKLILCEGRKWRQRFYKKVKIKSFLENMMELSREVKTKIFDSGDSERIIRVFLNFFRNLTFFGRRAPTNMKCAHTHQVALKQVCHEFCPTTSARQEISTPSVSARQTQLMTWW